MGARSPSGRKLLRGISLLGVLGAIALVSTIFLQAACTARYSQSLSGAIPQVQGKPVSTESTGLTVFGIAFSEPTPAHEQVTELMGGCQSLNAVEVDYREMVFLIVGIPKVSVEATCVSSE